MIISFSLSLSFFIRVPTSSTFFPAFFVFELISSCCSFICTTFPLIFFRPTVIPSSFTSNSSSLSFHRFLAASSSSFISEILPSDPVSWMTS